MRVCAVLGELRRVLEHLGIVFPKPTFGEMQKQLQTLIDIGNRFQKDTALMIATGAAIRQLLPDAASVQPHKLPEWCHLQKIFVKQCQLMPFLEALFAPGVSAVATTEAFFRDLR